jgi:hypothetical protein
MSNLPKRLPCKDCKIKPRLRIIAHGYSDKDDEYVLECPKCRKKTPSEFLHLLPSGQILEVTKEWNRMNG